MHISSYKIWLTQVHNWCNYNINSSRHELKMNSLVFSSKLVVHTIFMKWTYICTIVSFFFRQILLQKNRVPPNFLIHFRSLLISPSPFCQKIKPGILFIMRHSLLNSQHPTLLPSPPPDPIDDASDRRWKSLSPWSGFFTVERHVKTWKVHPRRIPPSNTRQLKIQSPTRSHLE
jgi:hypothetical protein